MIKHERFEDTVLLLFLEYLDSNLLNFIDYESYISTIIEKSIIYRQVLIEKETENVDVWENSEYQIARYKSGIIADLLGYFDLA